MGLDKYFMLEYIEPMYRGPSGGPCIGTIYPTLLGFGGIQATILSYPLLYNHHHHHHQSSSSEIISWRIKLILLGYASLTLSGS